MLVRPCQGQHSLRAHSEIFRNFVQRSPLGEWGEAFTRHAPKNEQSHSLAMRLGEAQCNLRGISTSTRVRIRGLFVLVKTNIAVWSVHHDVAALGADMPDMPTACHGGCGRHVVHWKLKAWEY